MIWDGLPELRIEEITNPDYTIADELDSDALGIVAHAVKTEYEIDKQSRSEWEDDSEVAMEMALQITQPKTFPWENAANIKYPLLTKASLQFGSRAYPAIIQGRNVVKGKVVGSDQGLPEQVAMDENGEPVVVSWIIEPGAKRRRADRVAAYMNYQLLEQMEEWEEETDRLVHILPILGCAFRKTYYSPARGRLFSELKLPGNVVVNNHAKSCEEAPRITELFDLYPFEIEQKIRTEVFRDFEFALSSDSQEPQRFLEQHRYIDLDGDGFEEPYVVTVHEKTSEIVRIAPRFSLRGIERRAGEISRIRAENYYTKYGFIPHPKGYFYDLGFGQLLRSISETLDTTVNQMIDAGTLANNAGGFLGKGMRIKGGAQRFRPFEFKPVNVMGDDIRKNVYRFDFPGPNRQTFALLELLIAAGDDITSVKDVLTGELPTGDIPIPVYMGLIEQGTKQLSTIFKRVHRALKREFRKIFELNGIYLDEKQYFTVLDETQAVSRTDFDPIDADVSPVSDATMVSDVQKMTKAQFLLDWAATSPFANRQEVDRRVLEAANIENIDQLMVPPAGDPKTEIDAFKAETDRLRATADADKKQSEKAELEARAQLHLAKADAEDDRTTLEAVKIDDARDVSDLERRSDNARSNGTSQTA